MMKKGMAILMLVLISVLLLIYIRKTGNSQNEQKLQMNENTVDTIISDFDLYSY